VLIRLATLQIPTLVRKRARAPKQAATRLGRLCRLATSSAVFSLTMLISWWFQSGSDSMSSLGSREIKFYFLIQENHQFCLEILDLKLLI
jgi:hypothetical protein